MVINALFVKNLRDVITAGIRTHEEAPEFITEESCIESSISVYRN